MVAPHLLFPRLVFLTLDLVPGLLVARLELLTTIVVFLLEAPDMLEPRQLLGVHAVGNLFRNLSVGREPELLRLAFTKCGERLVEPLPRLLPPRHLQLETKVRLREQSEVSAGRGRIIHGRPTNRKDLALLPAAAEKTPQCFFSRHP